MRRNKLRKLSLTVPIVLAIALSSSIASAKKTIYVSPDGDDSYSGASPTYACETLYGAYTKIVDLTGNEVNQEHEIILLSGYSSTTIELGIPPEDEDTFNWQISGTQSYPITITSGDEMISIDPANANETSGLEPNKYDLKFDGVSYINISRVEFLSATVGVRLYGTDHCTIEYCKFTGSELDTGSGAGMIWIGGKSSSACAEYNIIKSNYFFGSTVTDTQKDHLYHAIYLSEFSNHNFIKNNTIKSNAYTGCSIQLYHDYLYDNNVVKNYIYRENSSNPYCILFDWEKCASCNQGNSIVDNIMYRNSSPRSLLHLEDPLENYNVIEGNRSYYRKSFYEDSRPPHDPYWLGYDPSKITGRVVSGDFDGDGHADDIAAFYDYGTNRTRIHVWQRDDDNPDNQLHYSTWYNNETLGNPANSSTGITGRVVAGDFNGDGKDDIAAFWLMPKTRILVWTSTGSSFNLSQDTTGWWYRDRSYYATGIIDRVVAGNFSGTDNRDDIAAIFLYDGSTRILVWEAQSDNTFDLVNGATGMWSRNRTYWATGTTGRVVAGSFMGGSADDIAALFLYGGESRMLVWRKDSNEFVLTSSQGLWKHDNEDIALNTTRRVVSGDFDNDGYHDDVAAFWPNSGDTDILVWRSNGSTFAPANNQIDSWWNSDRTYYATNTAGRIIAGDFTEDGKVNGISAFFDYPLDQSVRSFLWTKDQGSAFAFNGIWGFPWRLGPNLTK